MNKKKQNKNNLHCFFNKLCIRRRSFSWGVLVDEFYRKKFSSNKFLDKKYDHHFTLIVVDSLESIFLWFEGVVIEFWFRLETRKKIDFIEQ